MTKHVKSTIHSRHNTVSTKHPLTQHIAHSSQPLSDLKKQNPAIAVRSYRVSKTSATMRIPHELRGKVQALVDAYRRQQASVPDTWN
jgi:hypothetical protein